MAGGVFARGTHVDDNLLGREHEPVLTAWEAGGTAVPARPPVAWGDSGAHAEVASPPQRPNSTAVTSVVEGAHRP
ncbi:hypothetical protein SCAB_3171 [Streptomyces scabiei 87.22]|uniref:Uncharacterized protein n=1 Tax=Streptomyces scabiei (strain 87.22) TaxID=680198 RepID=C9ZG86_STRSW|nr:MULTISPECIES: hypothetical protein [Streptomyces]CBG67527.1 hypothetical protein SCAB_3171 [Streptomyces scabiei 87.22]MDX2627541.1 hypothetical protein [Streptomyces scabiei]MDX2686231.1 hypothetical protein [Streptomyces scabiei]MDX2805060.1 hypothetical protein [Streptomyces scabiei]MDX2859034.1 hypothetical protein [Streptomyces scabiei]